MEVKVNGSSVTTHPFLLSESSDSNSGSGFVNYELTIDSTSQYIYTHESYSVIFTATDKAGTGFRFDSIGEVITINHSNRPTIINYANDFDTSKALVFFKDNRFRQTGNEFNTDKFLVTFTDADLEGFGETVTPEMEVKVDDVVTTNHPFVFSESTGSDSSTGIVSYELTIDSTSLYINEHKSYSVTFTTTDKSENVYADIITIDDGDFDDDGIPNTKEDSKGYDDEDANDPIDFSSTVVSDKDFNGMNIYNTTFGSTKFENCDFRGTNFHNCKFSGDRTIFTSCILHNAKFINILTESDIKIQTGNTFVAYIGISSSMYTVTHSRQGNNDIFTVEFKVSGLPTLLQDIGSSPTNVNAKEIYNAILVRIHNYAFKSSAPDSLDYYNLLVTNHNLNISDNSYTVDIETVSGQSQQFSGLVKNIPADNNVINSSKFSLISDAESPTPLQTVRILRAASTSEIDLKKVIIL